MKNNSHHKYVYKKLFKKYFASTKYELMDILDYEGISYNPQKIKKLY
ncbi:MAG: hypothetical protein MJ224_00250 [archaeon]|nr:hypothetical protein [archaeon]